jgi:glycosyltransferase involved in cell wall biosynthesis
MPDGVAVSSTALRTVVNQAIRTRRQVQSQLALRAYRPGSGAGGQITVSVVMPLFNAEDHVVEAAESILAQTLTDLELIVVDDASTDGSWQRISALAEADPRVRLFRCSVNRGPYWARNLGWLHARGAFIANQDADDLSEPERLAAQVAAMNASDAVISVTNYQRIDPDTRRVVMNRGLPERLSYQSMLIRRDEVLSELGFYDTVRFSADDEYYHRAIKRFSRDRIIHIRRPLYKAKVISSGLTFMDESSLMEHEDPDGHLSPTRRAYVEQYRRWHQGASDLRVAFPMRRRPFRVPDEMIPPDGVVDDRVTASVVSIPSRVSGLEHVVGRLAQQVDRLTVYLNNYDDIPGFLHQPNVEVARSQDYGDIQDNGKFFFGDVLSETDIHCTVDDDIAYPYDYVSRSVAKVLQYGGQAAVGYHGIRIKAPFRSYYDLQSRHVDSFRTELLTDEPAHIIGTGTLSYSRSTLQPRLSDFGAPGMADLWFALYGRRYGTPFVCVAHDSGFLTELPDATIDSLYGGGVRDDRLQTDLVKGAIPWSFPPLFDATQQG